MKMHALHYIVLLFILCVGIWTFFQLSGNSFLQLWVGIITTISYVAWGLIHHTIQKDLHAKVVIEYILIGAIAIVLLTTMLM